MPEKRHLVRGKGTPASAKSNLTYYKNTSGKVTSKSGRNPSVSSQLTIQKKYNAPAKAHDDTAKTQDDTEKAQDDTEKTQDDTEKTQDDTEKAQDESEKTQYDTEKTQDNTEKSQDDTEKTHDERPETTSSVPANTGATPSFRSASESTIQSIYSNNTSKPTRKGSHESTQKSSELEWEPSANRNGDETAVSANSNGDETAVSANRNGDETALSANRNGDETAVSANRNGDGTDGNAEEVKNKVRGSEASIQTTADTNTTGKSSATINGENQTHENPQNGESASKEDQTDQTGKGNSKQKDNKPASLTGDSISITESQSFDTRPGSAKPLTSGQTTNDTHGETAQNRTLNHEDNKVTKKKGIDKSTQIPLHLVEQSTQTNKCQLYIQQANLTHVIQILHEEIAGTSETQSKRHSVSSKSSSNTCTISSLVEEVMQKALGKITARASRNKNLSLITLKMDSMDLQQQPGSYRIRVMLEDPFPPGTFQLLSGSGHGLQPGQGLLGLNTSGLVSEERAAVKRMYSEFFNGDYLSPTKATKWIHKCIQASFASMADTVIQNQTIQIISYLRGQAIHVNMMADDADTEERTDINIQILPGMMISGWPACGTFRVPLPSRYSRHSRDIAGAIQKRIDAEEKLICLDGCITTDNQGSHASLSSFGGSILSSRASMRSSTTTKSLRMDPSNIWTVSFRIVEKFVQDKLLQCDFIQPLKIGNEVLLRLKDRNPHWSVLTPVLLREILLSMTKQLNTSPSACFKALVTRLQSAVASGSATEYFQPKVNVLAGIDKAKFQETKADLDWIVRNCEKQPYVISQMCE